MIPSKWIKYNEQLNALDYLDKCFCFLKSVGKNPQNWKWVIITIHSALYGFSISASRGLSSESVVIKDKKGYAKLITFGKALERCQNASLMKANINYEYFEFTEQQKESLSRLQNIFRNNFEHFKPKTWLIEVHEIPLMILDCLDVLKLLLVYSDIRWRLKSTKYRKAKSLIYQSKKIIKDSVLYKESIILRSSLKN